ncbi:MAG: hypothetical protein KUF74_15785 [Candidatus Thiodiazotropha sp. (ex Ctena orbiculata)]|nr:hypothetical protein [Candidatus Thiodiazotropha taylori]
MKVQQLSIIRYSITLITVFIFIGMYAFQETNILEPEFKYLKQAGWIAFWILLADAVGWVIDRYIFKIKDD